MSRVAAIIESVQGPSVLDVGCTGFQSEHFNASHWVHKHLRDRFPDVTGIDINADLVRDMAERGYTNVFAADAEDFSLGRTFDTIVAGELLEHLSNPGRFLACCRQHLNPGGRLVLTVPNPFSLCYFLYALVKYPNTSSEPTHTLWQCPQTLATLAANNGFRVLDSRLIEDYLPDLYRTTKYVLFSWFIRLCRFLPLRLRGNCLVAVLEPSEDGKRDLRQARAKDGRRA